MTRIVSRRQYECLRFLRPRLDRAREFLGMSDHKANVKFIFLHPICCNSGRRKRKSQKNERKVRGTGGAKRKKTYVASPD